MKFTAFKSLNYGLCVGTHIRMLHNASRCKQIAFSCHGHKELLCVDRYYFASNASYTCCCLLPNVNKSKDLTSKKHEEPRGNRTDSAQQVRCARALASAGTDGGCANTRSLSSLPPAPTTLAPRSSSDSTLHMPQQAHSQFFR